MSVAKLTDFTVTDMSKISDAVSELGSLDNHIMEINESGDLVVKAGSVATLDGITYKLRESDVIKSIDDGYIYIENASSGIVYGTDANISAAVFDPEQRAWTDGASKKYTGYKLSGGNIMQLQPEIRFGFKQSPLQNLDYTKAMVHTEIHIEYNQEYTQNIPRGVFIFIAARVPGGGPIAENFNLIEKMWRPAVDIYDPPLSEIEVDGFAYRPIYQRKGGIVLYSTGNNYVLDVDTTRDDPGDEATIYLLEVDL